MCVYCVYFYINLNVAFLFKVWLNFPKPSLKSSKCRWFFKILFLFDFSNFLLSSREKSRRNTITSSSFPADLDLGFQQKQSSVLQHWELNVKLTQVFSCRERKGLHRESFQSATNEKFPSDFKLAEHFLCIDQNINLYLWVPNLQKPADFRVLWWRGFIPISSCVAEWFPPANTLFYPLSQRAAQSP